MKTRFLLTIGLLTATYSATAEEKPDTIVNVEKPAVVKIISTGNSKRIIVEGRKGQPDYKLDYQSTVNASRQDSIDEMWACR